jgi:hypothetical protein
MRAREGLPDAVLAQQTLFRLLAAPARSPRRRGYLACPYHSCISVPCRNASGKLQQSGQFTPIRGRRLGFVLRAKQACFSTADAMPSERLPLRWSVARMALSAGRLKFSCKRPPSAARKGRWSAAISCSAASVATIVLPFAVNICDAVRVDPGLHFGLHDLQIRRLGYGIPSTMRASRWLRPPGTALPVFASTATCKSASG